MLNIVISMFQFAKDNAILCTIFNVVFGYAIYYACILSIWQIIVHEDIKYNPDYTYDDDYYWPLPTIIVMGIFAYIINFSQVAFMSLIYSRHYCGINFILHHLMIIYVWIVLGMSTTDGCKNRVWLTCHKNETVILNNDGIIQSKSISVYGIITLLIIEVVFSVYSYCKNRHVKFYFCENGVGEIIMMVLFHYMIGVFYILIPTVIWFCFCLISFISNESDGGGGVQGPSPNVWNTHMNTLFNGRSYTTNRKQINKKYVRDIENGIIDNIDI